MLSLVVNNDTKKKLHQTCRTQCQLFDDITNSCSIKLNVDVDNPRAFYQCGHVLLKDDMPNAEFDFAMEEEWVIEDEDVFHELWGDRFNQESSQYPLRPDFPSKRSDAIWYVSPDQTFGCWIVNQSKHKFLSVPALGEVESGWSKHVYKSPFPLHDHHSSACLCSKIVWLVDEDGFGQYVLLMNGKISEISYPKPKDWKPKKKIIHNKGCSTLK